MKFGRLVQMFPYARGQLALDEHMSTGVFHCAQGLVKVMLDLSKHISMLAGAKGGHSSSRTESPEEAEKGGAEGSC